MQSRAGLSWAELGRPEWAVRWMFVTYLANSTIACHDALQVASWMVSLLLVWLLDLAGCTGDMRAGSSWW